MSEAESPIDLLTFGDSGFEGIAPQDFLTLQHFLNRALPQLSSDPDRVMALVEALVAAGGEDLAANMPNGALVAWCRADPSRGRAVLDAPWAGDRRAGAHLTFALQGLSAIEEARRFVTDLDDERRLSGMTALGRIPDPDPASRAETLRVLQSALGNRQDDRVAAHVVQSTAALLGLQTLRRALAAPGEGARNRAAHFLWSYPAIVSDAALYILLPVLLEVNAEHLGALREVDFTLRQLLPGPFWARGLDLMAGLLLRREVPIPLRVFRRTAHAVGRAPPPILSRAVCTWMLSGKPSSPASASLWRWRTSRTSPIATSWTWSGRCGRGRRLPEGSPAPGAADLSGGLGALRLGPGCGQRGGSLPGERGGAAAHLGPPAHHPHLQVGHSAGPASGRAADDPASPAGGLGAARDKGHAAIQKNPALQSPVTDAQVTDIQLFLQFWLARTPGDKRAAVWVHQLAFRLIFTLRMRSDHPITSADYRDLMEHPRDRSDAGFAEATRASVLIPVLAAWLAAFGLREDLEHLADVVDTQLEHCSLQLWLPDATSEAHLYVSDELHGTSLMDLPVEIGGERPVDMLRRALEAHPETQALSAVRANLWPIVFVALRHYRLPVPPQFWAPAMNPLPATNEGHAVTS